MGNSRSLGWAGGVFVLAVNLGVSTAFAQGYGLGASPGRAAYRPPSQWNDGPFYTAPHWDPWAPHAATSTGLITTEANDPPYTSAPRGRYSSYYPEQAATRPYQQGFSPYSGYADWYKKAYHVQDTPANLANATNRFFQSSPVAADPRYLDPRVSAALSQPNVAVSQGKPAQRPVSDGTGLPPNTIVHVTPARPHTHQAVIYRGAPPLGR